MFNKHRIWIVVSFSLFLSPPLSIRSVIKFCSYSFGSCYTKVFFFFVVTLFLFFLSVQIINFLRECDMVFGNRTVTPSARQQLNSNNNRKKKSRPKIRRVLNMSDEYHFCHCSLLSHNAFLMNRERCVVEFNIAPVCCIITSIVWYIKPETRTNQPI